MDTARIVVVGPGMQQATAMANRLRSMGMQVVGEYIWSTEAAERAARDEAEVVLVMPSGSDDDWERVALSLEQSKGASLIYLLSAAQAKAAVKEPASSKQLYYSRPLNDLNLKSILLGAAELSRLRSRKKRHVSGASSFDRYVFVRADYKLNKIDLTDLYYVEARKDYINLHTSGNMFTVHSTMKEMLQLLPAHLFIRIHRSFIVNKEKISSIKYPELTLEKKAKVLPIGGLYRKELFEQIKIV